MGHSSSRQAGPASSAGRSRSGGGTTDARSRRRRMLTWILLAGAGALLINAIVGENGYLATVQLKRTEAEMLRQLADTRAENQRLKTERQLLQTDPDALEHAIRDQLGFIRPGEVTVIVNDIPAVAPPPVR